MPINNKLTKEQVVRIINNMRINLAIDTDYVYDVYETSICEVSLSKRSMTSFAVS